MARSTAAKIHDQAKSYALRCLKERYEAEYIILFESKRRSLEKEYGYVDERPEANKERGRRHRAAARVAGSPKKPG